MQVQKVETSSIIVDEKIQQREQLNENYIDELSIEITEGAVLPPLDVYDIDGDLLLTDGFHRLQAFIKAGIDTVEVNIYKGNERDAVLHAVGANANHGPRRTNPLQLQVTKSLSRVQVLMSRRLKKKMKNRNLIAMILLLR